MACYFEAAVVFLRDIAHFSQQRVDIPPFEIVGNGMLENSIEGALMSAGQWSGCFHISF